MEVNMEKLQNQLSSSPTVEELERAMATTADLADLFGVSVRQVELLANGGVLENIGSARAMRFRDLRRDRPAF